MIHSKENLYFFPHGIKLGHKFNFILNELRNTSGAWAINKNKHVMGLDILKSHDFNPPTSKPKIKARTTISSLSNMSEGSNMSLSETRLPHKLPEPENISSL